MSSANSDGFISSFPVCISFYSLIAMARTSKIMLNSSGENGHPYLVPDSTGKSLKLSPLSMMLAVALSYMVITVLRYVPSTPIFGVFLS